MSTIGDRMKALRGETSLREMADAIGIKYSAWARYESGDVLPGAEIITKICRAHAVSADWLLGLDIGPSSRQINAYHGAAVAIGPGANAISGGVRSMMDGDCRKCPYKAAVKKLQKAGMSFPDIPKS